MAASGPILIVDDDPNLLQVAKMVLEHAGHRVLLAHHGREALDLLRVEKPALILLDVRMPVLDGRGFMSEIRSFRETLPPIVLFSAAEDAQALALELNVNGYLEKPFDLSQLIDTVNRYK